MSPKSKTADQTETASDQVDHFEFGENWSRFLNSLDQPRITAAKNSLLNLLHRDSLEGKKFLDAGCGSGLFSLAAFQLGASVVSFDLDADSVSCASRLKQQFAQGAQSWNVLAGSLTDFEFIRSLGEFDIVYCWGVAHHTGAMWQCIENLAVSVRPGGSIVLAIYNDQLYVSRIWRGVKRIYQLVPRPLRPLYVVAIGSLPFFKRLMITVLASILRLVTLRNPFIPFSNWFRETQARGMHSWYDLVDWVGGWPFEVARPEEVFRFFRDRGFVLTELTTSVGHGCNEFVFARSVESIPTEA